MYNRLIRQMAKDLKEKPDKITRISNETVRTDVVDKIEKNRIDALSPEERKAFYAEKRRERDDKKTAERLKLKEEKEKEKAEMKAKMCVDVQLVEKLGNLDYKSMKKITGGHNEFTDKYST